MKRSFFKFFSNLVFANNFLDGRVHCKNLQYFSDLEDRQVRGDANDGSLVYDPKGGLVLTKVLSGELVALPDHVFRSSVKKAEIFIFCMSNWCSDRLWNDFDAAACVEITDRKRFLGLFQAKVESSGSKWHGDHVRYLDHSAPPKHTWALPELVCITKGLSFAHQSEYRAFFGQPDVFGKEGVDTSVVPRTSIPEKNEEAATKFRTIEIGDIRGMCRLHTR